MNTNEIDEAVETYGTYWAVVVSANSENAPSISKEYLSFLERERLRLQKSMDQITATINNLSRLPRT